MHLTGLDVDTSAKTLAFGLPDGRLPDAAPGTRGLSLFVVPKLIPGEDGSLGARNSLRVVSLEHKMGLHGSPTCVMAFEGAAGWRVGEPGGGGVRGVVGLRGRMVAAVVVVVRGHGKRWIKKTMARCYPLA